MEKRNTIAVVLGSGLLNDGTPTEVTAMRAEHAAELAKYTQLDKIILSGFGPPGPTPTHGKSEAAVMADIVRTAFADQSQLPPLCIEDKSFDTFGNAVFTATEFLRAETPGTLYIVTSPFHLERAIYMFSHILGNAWTIKGHACAEWSKEDRQPGAPAAMQRARDFFSDVPKGDMDAALKKLKGRKPYATEVTAQHPAEASQSVNK